jgi:hypothetical protein
MTLAVLSVVATLLPPLRALGPGRSYMKAGIFPTAYTLAFGIGSLQGLTNPVGIVTLVCLSFSLGAIWFFYAYVRGRETEQTAMTPPALTEATAALAALEPGACSSCRTCTRTTCAITPASRRSGAAIVAS